MKRPAMLAILGQVLLGLLATASPAQEPLRIAVFNVDATPPLGSPVAYAPTRSIEDPLSARGIVLLGNGKPIVLCAVDWIGIANAGHDAWRQALAEAAGTTPDRVAVHTLHQHDGVRCDISAEQLLAQRGLGGKHFNLEFESATLERAAAAIRAAIKHPHAISHLGIGQAKVEKVASNRRVLGADGKVKIVRWSKMTDPAAIAAPEGVIDPYVRLLSFWDGDKPLAVLSYYATHPQSYYGQGDVTAEFVGLARSMREAAVPGVAHVHFNGASGNVTAGKYNDGSPAMRKTLTERLAAGMEAAWKQTVKTPLTAADIGWQVRDVKLPAAPHLDREKLLATLDDEKAAAAARLGAASDIAWLDRAAAGKTIAVSCLRLGKASVLHMPGELFIEYQLAAQGQLPQHTVCMAAYGDYGPGYIGTEIAYGQGGYETSPRASRVAPAVESVLQSAIKELLVAAAVDDKPFETAVFSRGQEGYFAYRIPSLIASRQGTLLLFCEGRKTELGDDGNNDLVLRRSFDGGRTWQPMQLVHEEGGDAVISIGNPCAVVDRDSGTIWLTMNRKNSRVLLTSSRDDGETWAPPRDITPQVSREGWGWYAMGPGVGIQLARGNHKGRLVIPANHRETPDRAGPSSSHVIYSDDRGETWKLGGNVGLHTNECQVVELSDGTLLINARNHWGRSGMKRELAGKRIIARSSDGGETWSKPEFDDTLIEPTCQASLIALRDPAPDGRMRLVFANPASTSARKQMTIRISPDDGRTWPISTLIHDGMSAYSALAELPLGRIGLVYEKDDRQSIAFHSLHIPK